MLYKNKPLVDNYRVQIKGLNVKKFYLLLYSIMFTTLMHACTHQYLFLTKGALTQLLAYLISVVLVQSLA